MERTVTDSDADLVRLLGENGRNGFDAVFNAYAGKVYRYAQRIAVNQADAEELVQETFLTLWAKHRSVARSDSSLLPWLLATCRNHGNNLYRKNRRNETTVLDPDRAARSPAEELAVDDLQWVLSEFDAMSPLDKEICRLCLVEGVPYKDAAKTLGLAQTAVAKRVSRTRSRLRNIRSQVEGSELK